METKTRTKNNETDVELESGHSRTLCESTFTIPLVCTNIQYIQEPVMEEKPQIEENISPNNNPVTIEIPIDANASTAGPLIPYTAVTEEKSQIEENISPNNSPVMNEIAIDANASTAGPLVPYVAKREDDEPITYDAVEIDEDAAFEFSIIPESEQGPLEPIDDPYKPGYDPRRFFSSKFPRSPPGTKRNFNRDITNARYFRLFNSGNTFSCIDPIAVSDLSFGTRYHFLYNFDEKKQEPKKELSESESEEEEPISVPDDEKSKSESEIEGPESEPGKEKSESEPEYQEQKSKPEEEVLRPEPENEVIISDLNCMAKEFIPKNFPNYVTPRSGTTSLNSDQNKMNKDIKHEPEEIWEDPTSLWNDLTIDPQADWPDMDDVEEEDEEDDEEDEEIKKGSQKPVPYFTSYYPEDFYPNTFDWEAFAQAQGDYSPSWEQDFPWPDDIDFEEAFKNIPLKVDIPRDYDFKSLTRRSEEFGLFSFFKFWLSKDWISEGLVYNSPWSERAKSKNYDIHSWFKEFKKETGYKGRSPWRKTDEIEETLSIENTSNEQNIFAPCIPLNIVKNKLHEILDKNLEKELSSRENEEDIVSENQKREKETFSPYGRQITEDSDSDYDLMPEEEMDEVLSIIEAERTILLEKWKQDSPNWQYNEQDQLKQGYEKQDHSEMEREEQERAILLEKWKQNPPKWQYNEQNESKQENEKQDSPEMESQEQERVSLLEKWKQDPPNWQLNGQNQLKHGFEKQDLPEMESEEQARAILLEKWKQDPPSWRYDGKNQLEQGSEKQDQSEVKSEEQANRAPDPCDEVNKHHQGCDRKELENQSREILHRIGLSRRMIKDLHYLFPCNWLNVLLGEYSEETTEKTVYKAPGDSNLNGNKLNGPQHQEFVRLAEGIQKPQIADKHLTKERKASEEKLHVYFDSHITEWPNSSVSDEESMLFYDDWEEPIIGPMPEYWARINAVNEIGRPLVIFDTLLAAGENQTSDLQPIWISPDTDLEEAMIIPPPRKYRNLINIDEEDDYPLFYEILLEKKVSFEEHRERLKNLKRRKQLGKLVNTTRPVLSQDSAVGTSSEEEVRSSLLQTKKKRIGTEQLSRRYDGAIVVYKRGEHRSMFEFNNKKENQITDEPTEVENENFPALASPNSIRVSKDENSSQEETYASKLKKPSSLPTVNIPYRRTIQGYAKTYNYQAQPKERVFYRTDVMKKIEEEKRATKRQTYRWPRSYRTEEKHQTSTNRYSGRPSRNYSNKPFNAASKTPRFCPNKPPRISPRNSSLSPTNPPRFSPTKPPRFSSTKPLRFSPTKPPRFSPNKPQRCPPTKPPRFSPSKLPSFSPVKSHLSSAEPSKLSADMVPETSSCSTSKVLPSEGSELSPRKVSQPLREVSQLSPQKIPKFSLEVSKLSLRKENGLASRKTSRSPDTSSQISTTKTSDEKSKSDTAALEPDKGGSRKNKSKRVTTDSRIFFTSRKKVSERSQEDEIANDHKDEEGKSSIPKNV